ncbi:hypothetical protein VNO80_10306 [Phaseolus coccineus]|uniref:Uncharacterized protein n=1 Tax=Phaseolus coccineus TaxID=3886 RepID=A0AAN9N8F4_PHACN
MARASPTFTSSPARSTCAINPVVILESPESSSCSLGSPLLDLPPHAPPTTLNTMPIMNIRTKNGYIPRLDHISTLVSYSNLLCNTICEHGFDFNHDGTLYGYHVSLGKGYEQGHEVLYLDQGVGGSGPRVLPLKNQRQGESFFHQEEAGELGGKSFFNKGKTGELGYGSRSAPYGVDYYECF